MTTFFTSDNHFGHHNIIEYSKRPFYNVEEMDAAMIDRWNSVVGKKDIVYHLGDFSLSTNNIINILAQLNGKIHLVPGNHEKCFSSRDKWRKEVQKYLGYGFASAQERMELKIGSHAVELCHLPFKNEVDPDQRFSQWRPIDRGQFLLHGHVHERWSVSGRMINVGVDVRNFTPISESEVSEIIADIIEVEQA